MEEYFATMGADVRTVVKIVRVFNEGSRKFKISPNHEEFLSQLRRPVRSRNRQAQLMFFQRIFLSSVRFGLFRKMNVAIGCEVFTAVKV